MPARVRNEPQDLVRGLPVQRTRAPLHARRVPVVGLADARQRATFALREVSTGSDPSAVKIQVRHAETFSDLAKDYMDQIVSVERPAKILAFAGSR